MLDVEKPEQDCDSRHKVQSVKQVKDKWARDVSVGNSTYRIGESQKPHQCWGCDARRRMLSGR